MKIKHFCYISATALISSFELAAANTRVRIGPFFKLLLAAGFSLVAGHAFSQAKPIIIQGGHTVAATNSQATPWAKFKEVVEKKSGGKVKVEVFPNSMMGNDNEIMEKVQLGALQMGNASTSNISNIFPKFGAFELPYVVTDVLDNMKLFYRDGKLGGPVFDVLNKEMLAKNLRIMWISPASFRGIGSTKLVLVPDDLKGLKVRSTASSIDRAALQAFGANPVAMGFGEVYTALQQGTIDAEGLPPDLMYDMKHQEVVKYVVMNDYNSYMIVCAMNAKFYNDLPKDVQSIVDAAAIEAVKYANEQWTPMLNDRVKKMEAAGVKIHYPTDAEWKLWKAPLKPVVDKFSPVIGSDFVKLVQDTLKSK